MCRFSTLAGLCVAALIGLAGGCVQKCNPIGENYLVFTDLALRERTTGDGTPQAFANIYGDRVRTVLEPQGTLRPISLRECVALALENGRLGNDNIRVLAMDPAVEATTIDQSLAKFDARWQNSMIWTSVDQPIASAIQSVAAGNRTAIVEERAELQTALVKPLPTGGVAGITFRTDYLLSNLATQRVNPAYRPQVGLTFEQPLLQGYGVTINQLRTAHPGSLLQQLRGGAEVPGILLTRLNYEESRADFERRTQDLLFAVEEAYWNLYTSYWNLYSREVGERQSARQWQIARERFNVGAITLQDFAQIEEQYQSFRGERLRALGNGNLGVLEAERNLRQVVGLPPNDGQQLIPSDVPNLAPVVPDWPSAVNEALANRPELVQARLRVEAARLVLQRDANSLLPDLRFTSSYDINGLGNRLDSNLPTNALRSLTSNNFNDWSVGLVGEMPLGFREANARVRRSRLQLTQTLYTARNLEEVVVLGLQRSYRAIIEAHEQIRIQQARRRVATVQVNARARDFEEGKGDIVALVIAQQNLANALRDEHVAIGGYNVALADFERGKGTILRHDNVTLAEGPLPTCVAQRASEHIRQREKALVLREREWPTPAPALPGGPTPAPLPALPLDQPLPAPRPESAPPPGPVEAAPPLDSVLPLPRVVGEDSRGVSLLPPR